VETKKNDTKLILPLNRKQKFRKTLKLYVLPITIGVIFLAIIIFLIIPSILNIFSTLDEISTKNQSYSEQLAMLDKLKILNSNASTINSELTGVNTITTSDQTEVVKFRNKITDLTNLNSLEVFSQQLTENDPNIVSGGNSATEITLKEVPFTFQIEGSYTNVIKFFDDLSKIEDFVIIKEMKFTRTEKIASDNSTVWLLDLVLVKYQFNESDSLDQVYKNVPPNVVISPKVLEYIEQRQ
jgi:Tfp pilus assembly protein PilO